MQWLQEKNPYLALRSLSAEGKSHHFPFLKIQIQEDAQVLFVEGALRAFMQFIPFLEKGGVVVFIEKNVERALAFLALPDFVFHSNVEIILDEEIEYQKVARKYTFKKQQFIGKLTKFKSYVNQTHLALSEYADYGQTILRNIQSNLLHSKAFIHGETVRDFIKGKRVILCGSGPSLEEVKKWEGKGLIFAAGSAIPKLIKMGIKIDAGFVVDPWPPIDEYSCLKGVSFPLYYQNRMCEKLFRLHQGPKIWMGYSEAWEIEKWIYKELGLDQFIFDAGWNAGCFAFHCAKFLGCDPIITCGLDGSEKRDLHEGLNWIEEFRNRPQDHISPIIGLDFTKVVPLIKKLNDKAISNSLDTFLEKNGNPVILEAELIGEPLYEYLIRPLWDLFKGFIGEEFLHFVLFAKKVLEFQSERVLLTANNGVIVREGEFRNGKKEGVHIIRNDKGIELLKAEFQKDLPVHKTIRRNEQGLVIEELFYHNPEKFDRRLYSEIGKLRCEGVFEGDQFMERTYTEDGAYVERQGLFKEGRILWD